MRSKHRARALGLLIFESALIYMCGVAAIQIRFAGDAAEAMIARRGWVKLLAAMAVAQVAFYLFDLYDFKAVGRRPGLTLRIMQALGLAAVTLALLFYAVPQMMLGRGVFALALALMLTAMVGWRAVATWLLGHPRLSERVLILGTDLQAISIAREIMQRRGHGYEVIGFVGQTKALVGQSLINPSVIGVIDDLEELVRRRRPDRIVVALPDRRGKLPLDLLLRLKVRDEIQVEESSRFFERLTGKISTDRLQPGQLVFAETGRWMRRYRRLRRVFDVVSSLIGFAVFSPLMALTAIAIRIESPGPVVYTQERVGLHGRKFRIFKFRSMRSDAEAKGPVWACENDPRVTRVGRIIRRLRIDETPQFFNILRGEMSLIGPRPERPEFVEQFEERIPYYSERHLVKPGLTGWAQVSYPYGASFEDAREKHQYDLYYIKNQSPLLDAIILLETARVVLFGVFHDE
ncbi:MAG TPA: TIGR03013 family XrtA/PEP-CTERM system glycosyltransferase [Blastocatellia bacterium]|nr:TIGR03013 family XrtA/PEP-CTERM system glycosyltransferase [Blastocatellia bacterium]